MSRTPKSVPVSFFQTILTASYSYPQTVDLLRMKLYMDAQFDNGFHTCG